MCGYSEVFPYVLSLSIYLPTWFFGFQIARRKLARPKRPSKIVHQNAARCPCCQLLRCCNRPRGCLFSFIFSKGCMLSKICNAFLVGLQVLRSRRNDALLRLLLNIFLVPSLLFVGGQ